MDKKVFTRFREIVYDTCGINLGPSKQALVEARVAKRLRALNLPDYVSYLDYLKKDKTGQETVMLLDVISTNVTNFFREPEHFQILSDIVTQWISKGQNDFKIWCAASSSGEEPYTIAMTLKETFRSSPRASARILATDISTSVLDMAKKGQYPEPKVKDIPKAFLNKYFSKSKTAGGSIFQARDDLRSMLTFTRLNLAHPPFPMKGSFDFVFCRNVMIYFDNDVRKRLIDEIHRQLKPGGYLLVGHAESLTGMIGNFKSVKPSVYVK